MIAITPAHAGSLVAATSDTTTGRDVLEMEVEAWRDSTSTKLRTENSQPLSFTDVPEGAQFYAEISWLASQGISTGWAQPDGSKLYKPLLPVNRDAMAAFMYRLAGSPAFAAPAYSPFTDVPPGAQFYKEITWLASKGISTGWLENGGTKTFRPLQGVNRDAMAAFMYRFAGSPQFSPPGTSPFTDTSPATQFYKEISWLATEQISTGWTESDGRRSFRPLSQVNRDAMAAFMFRLQSRLSAPVPECTPPLTHLSGTISQDFTLDVACSPTYVLDGPVTVAAEATLSLMAGTTLRAPSGASINIEGTLNVEGSESSPVVLTSTSDQPLLEASARVTALSSGDIWNGLQVKSGGAVTAKNLTVRHASTGISAHIPVDAAPTTVSLTNTSLSSANTCLSLQGPVVGRFQGSVRDCIVGVAADFAFNATGVDWGAGQGPGDATSGRPTLQGGNVSVFPWAGVQLPPAPSSLSTVPALDECGDYLFIGVRGSGESSTEYNLGMGDTIRTTYDEFRKEVQASKPGAVIRYQGLQYPAHAVPIIKQWDKVFDYFPGAWQGAVEILASIEREQSTCASAGERIVLSGYSQGAWAIHTALNYAAASDRVDMSRLAAVGLLGDAQRIAKATETQLGTAPDYTYGVANTQFLGSPIFGFSDWLARSTDDTVRQWRLESDVPMSKIVSIQSIPVAARGFTASYCGRYDPVCGLGDVLGVDLGVHNYTTGARQSLGRWMGKKALEVAPPVPLTGVRTVVTDTFSWNKASTYAIGLNGLVWAWGSNQSGQLGNGSTLDSPLPRMVRGLSNVQNMTAQCGTTYAIKTDGTLWSWGGNYYGQLGDGTRTNRSLPRQVQGIQGVKSVFSICDAVYALKSDGSVMAWGRNHDGQLGNGTTLDASLPTPVSGLADVKEIAGVNEHVYAVKNDGSVWAWGLMLRSSASEPAIRTQPVRLAVSDVSTVASERNGNAVYALTKAGRVWAWGQNSNGELGLGHTNPAPAPAENPMLSGITQIAAGSGNAYALKNDGSVWAWGYNGYGQLGNGTTGFVSTGPVHVSSLSSIESISAGQWTAFAVQSSGRVFAWGSNNVGQVGNGTETESVTTPTRVNTPYNFASLTYGEGSTYGVTSDGMVWAWGINSDGQLGIGSTANSSVPVRVGPRLD